MKKIFVGPCFIKWGNMDLGPCREVEVYLSDTGVVLVRFDIGYGMLNGPSKKDRNDIPRPLMLTGIKVSGKPDKKKVIIFFSTSIKFRPVEEKAGKIRCVARAVPNKAGEIYEVKL